MSDRRLFHIVCLLLERGPMTVHSLARELGVSSRTVRRDVAALSAAGVPVCTTQGSGGGVSLLDGFVPDRRSFPLQEQGQLLSALPLEAWEDPLAKLSALFRRTEEEPWLQVCLERWGDGLEGQGGLFPQLRRAILARHPVSFTCAGAREEGRRQVLPARLVYRQGAWYLQGFDLEREEYRLFPLSRLEEPAISLEVFRRRLEPPEVGPAGPIPPLFRVEARLRFSPALALRVYDEFDRDHIRVQPDGTLLVEAVFPREPWLEGWLLSFGPGLEVLAPEGLRRELARLAGEVARQYET